MRVEVFLEGGGDTKKSMISCRTGFKKLLDKIGVEGGSPSLIACGSRRQAYEKFKWKHQFALDSDDVVLLMVDSEDPMSSIDRPWDHLQLRNDDKWQKPDGAVDDQVLLMATCMETWIVADRGALRQQFGQCLQETALPPLQDLESRNRHDVQSSLEKATRQCRGPYDKGKKSYEVLGRLDPEALAPHLPSFRRARNILQRHSNDVASYHKTRKVR